MRILILALVIGCGKSGSLDATKTDPDTSGTPSDRYDPAHLTVVKATLTDEEWKTLTQESRLFTDIILGPDCLNEPVPQVFEWHPGSVDIDGEVLENVGFRKKGFIGSMSWDRPSLKVDSDRFVDGQEFADGTEHFTLNNNKQDPTRVHTCMAYYVFRKAGVPAPLCSFSTVEVNGLDLGVYSNVEPIKKAFLRRNFGNDDGDLYEGTASDFNDDFLVTFDIKSDGSTLEPLEELRDALALSDADLIAGLEQILDLDGFITEWAVENLIGHWDGYAQGSNNYYIYHSADDGLLHFIPWGADAVFEDPNDDPLFAASLLVQRLWNHPDAQPMYLDEAQRLLDEVWDEDELLAEVDRIEALIESHLLDRSKTVAGIDDVRDFIEGRRQVFASVIASPPYRPEYEKTKFCIDPIGSVAITFDTTWGSIAGDPFVHPATLEGDLNGEPFNDFYLGSQAGIDQDGTRVLAIIGVDQYFDELTQIIVILPDNPEPGTYPVDIAAIPAYVVTGSLNNPDPNAWELAAFLGGEIVFEEIATTNGAAVRGTIDAILLPNIFE